MTHEISKRSFLTGAAFAALLAGSACANAPTTSLRPASRPADLYKQAVPAAKALIEQANLGGRVSYAVMDVKTGKILEANDATVAMPPASVAKSITALYALDTLGAAHRFQTKLIATGSVVNGTLAGDLILAGGGDPTLDTDMMADMARRLKTAGVTKVAGKFLVWGGALPYQKLLDPDQPDYVGYNPSISGLALNYNRVHFEWRRGGSGYNFTMNARSKNYRPDVTIASVTIADRETPVFAYSSKANKDRWTVARSALGKGGARWLPVRQPAEYAGEVFRYFAQAQSISMPKAQVTNSAPRGNILVTHLSAPLNDILRDMLKYSTNLTAEMVGMAATRKRTGGVKSVKSSAAEMTQWANANEITGAKLLDHSGLSDGSRVEAGTLTLALSKAQTNVRLRPILKHIKMRDAQGKVNAGHPIKVQAKTGTLNFVSALSGYFTGPDGQLMAFTIFAGDINKRAAIKRSNRENPKGASGWNKRAKRLQQALIERWGALYN